MRGVRVEGEGRRVGVVGGGTSVGVLCMYAWLGVYNVRRILYNFTAI